MGRVKYNPYRKEMTLGIDWGLRNDPTAICIASTEFIKDETKNLISHFKIHQLRRIMDINNRGEMEKKSFEQQVDEILAAFNTSQHQFMKENNMKRVFVSQFNVYGDITGMGEGPMETMRSRMTTLQAFCMPLRECRFTRGDKITRTPEGYSIGKEAFAARLMQLSGSGRLHFPTHYENPDMILDEFGSYDIKVTEEGGLLVGANRSGKHDDLVTAAGLACLLNPRPLAAGDLKDRMANFGVDHTDYDPRA